MRQLQCCNSWYIQYDASILNRPTIITDSELQLPLPIIVNLSQLLRKYQQPSKLPITLPTSPHRYACTPNHCRSCHNVALPLEFVCRCWAANECIVSALKVAAVVVCVWPGSAEAMSFFFFRLVAAANCGCTGTVHLLSRLKAMLACTPSVDGWYSLCVQLWWIWKHRRGGSFGKKALILFEYMYIYTRNAFTLRCLMFTFVSADAHGARVLHVRIKILRVREANVW